MACCIPISRWLRVFDKTSSTVSISIIYVHSHVYPVATIMRDWSATSKFVKK